jgi:hypothetical protein
MHSRSSATCPSSRSFTVNVSAITPACAHPNDSRQPETRRSEAKSHWETAEQGALGGCRSSLATPAPITGIESPTKDPRRNSVDSLRLRKVTATGRSSTLAQALLKERLQNRAGYGHGRVLSLSSPFGDLPELWLADLELRDISESVALLLNDGRDELSNTLAFTLVHVDLDTRRSQPWGEELTAVLDARLARDALDWVAPVAEDAVGTGAQR